MKRGAEEYITKENGSSINPGAVPDEKRRMATAAQQTRRKYVSRVFYVFYHQCWLPLYGMSHKSTRIELDLYCFEQC